ncbi:MAG: ferrous iron transport protein A [Ignavibacteria bacterium]|nr:ferrous iron transport protein A [Ignavibacteria bacterium]
MLPLTLLKIGEKAELFKLGIKSDINDGINENLFRLCEMGFKSGELVEILQTGDTVILIKIHNSRIAISRQIANKIYVRKI